MQKLIKTQCEVGYIEQTQQQIDDELYSKKKEEINLKTEKKILKALKATNKESAIIKQLNLQNISNIIIHKQIIGGKVTKDEEKKLNDILKIEKIINNSLEAGRTEKINL